MRTKGIDWENKPYPEAIGTLRTIFFFLGAEVFVFMGVLVFLTIYEVVPLTKFDDITQIILAVALTIPPLLMSVFFSVAQGPLMQKALSQHLNLPLEQAKARCLKIYAQQKILRVAFVEMFAFGGLIFWLLTGKWWLAILSAFGAGAVLMMMPTVEDYERWVRDNISQMESGELEK